MARLIDLGHPPRSLPVTKNTMYRYAVRPEGTREAPRPAFLTQADFFGNQGTNELVRLT